MNTPSHGHDLGLVRPKRDGQSVVYSLRDGHVAIMLNEAIYHIEHVRLGDAGTRKRDRRAGQTR